MNEHYLYNEIFLFLKAGLQIHAIKYMKAAISFKNNICEVFLNYYPSQ
jgi:hypothetical protein